MTEPDTRLAVVLSHPTQYYSPWFRWLRTHTGLPFRVFYQWDFGVRHQRDPQFGIPLEWDIDLLSGYEHEFVPNTASDPGTHHFRGLRNPLLTARLAAWNPQSILFFGYKWESTLRAIRWGRRNRRRLLFRGDSHLLGRPRPPLPARLLLRRLYAWFDAFLAVGAANQDYFRAFGVPGSRIVFAPHAVNHEWFDPQREEPRVRAAQLRAELGIGPDTRVVLFAGKLVPQKQPLPLLEAFLQVGRHDAALVFVGDGPEKAALLERSRAAPAGRVHFLPFANQSEMPSRHLLADVFALPSQGHYETWGLAVNEAMHLGVPALVSDRVGCQRDLVTDGVTGWVFPVDAPAALAAKLRQSLENLAGTGARERIREAVTERIAGYTYRQTTAGLLAALAASPAQ